MKNKSQTEIALRRSMRFLRAQDEREGQRAYSLFVAMHQIDEAIGSLLRAGATDLALALDALHGKAAAKLRDVAFEPELAHLQAEIVALDKKIAAVAVHPHPEPTQKRRKHAASVSAGRNARAALRKRGCRTIRSCPTTWCSWGRSPLISASV